MARSRRALIFAAVFLVTLALDQGSKVWAHGLPVGVPRPVVAGYWDWELAYNPGMAFSFLTGAGAQVGLSIIAAIALVAIGITAARTRPEQNLRRVALALIAGGALGNLLDRVRDGAVTDFVRWHIHEHMWPVFNLADAALVIGVVLWAIDSGVSKRAARRSGATSERASEAG